MNISLKSGERLYLNGAVIRVDRKVTVELMNDVTFLLEAHVIQAANATTPLRQIYFSIQVMLMDPTVAPTAISLARSLIESARSAFRTPEITQALGTILDLVNRGRFYEAMKMLRLMYTAESLEMAAGEAQLTSTAA